MNYRHAFHAGNFADVVKHAVLARILTYLKTKDAPFRVVDTHAGAGSYDLASDAAERTGEWRTGVGKLLDVEIAEPARALLAPWLDTVRAGLGSGRLYYPGSPALALALGRDQDRFTFCEKHPEEASALRRRVGRDPRVTIVEGDGWRELARHVPPKERRGLVLIDPPFEQPKEFATIIEALAAAHRRWSTGIFAIWYPIKARREIDAFTRKLIGLGLPKTFQVELGLYRVERIDRLNGCGLILVNPPWPLEAEWKIIGQLLADILSPVDEGWIRSDWLVEEQRRG